jgi:hypothetical protein
MTPPTAAGATPPGPALSGRKLLARAAVALYPPAWRARYGDEVSALLDDSGGGLAAVASVAWRALPAWICPRHLHDRAARMRSSLATALLAWSMLTGLGLVFAQLIQLQSLMTPGYSGYDNFTTPGIYLVMVIAAASVTTLSAARGARAALAEPYPQAGRIMEPA